MIATGAPLIDIEVESGGTETSAGTSVPPRDGSPHHGSPHDAALPSRQSQAEPRGAGQALESGEGQRVRAAPAVRALAKRMGVDLAAVHGTGRSGLVTADDVMNAAPQTRPTSGGAQAPPAPRPVSTASTAGPARAGSAEHPPAAQPLAHATQAPAHLTTAPAHTMNVPEKLRGLRRAMATSMSLARDQVMNCTLFDDADLARWREGNDYTSRLLRAIAAGCAAEPALNAWFDGEAQTRTLHSHVDVGMAVDTREGLIVPVVRNVGSRGAEELRADVNRLKRAAQERTLAPEEMRDFTIMLTNFGMIAGRYATPVVVPPAVAILGAGRLSHDVVAVTGGVEAHLRLPLSLTFDHRCITGGEAARFLAAVLIDLQRTI